MGCRMVPPISATIPTSLTTYYLHRRHFKQTRISSPQVALPPSNHYHHHYHLPFRGRVRAGLSQHPRLSVMRNDPLCWMDHRYSDTNPNEGSERPKEARRRFLFRFSLQEASCRSLATLTPVTYLKLVIHPIKWHKTKKIWSWTASSGLDFKKYIVIKIDKWINGQINR